MTGTAQWPETWDAEIDVVVVGAGACGFAAALSAAEGGCRVLLLEKWNKPGGNTALSSGFIPAAGTRLQREAGVEDSPELMAEDILRKNGYKSDPELTLHLCRESAGIVHWLMDAIGIELRLVTDFLYGGQSVHRFHAPPSRSGAELIDGLMAAVARQPLITLVTSTPVSGLIPDETGAVAGVWAGGDPGQGGEAIRARKVILANNGFGGNAEMVRRYCPEIAGALYFGHPGNTGDGIRWGMELGAATRHMDAFQGHGSVAYPHGLLVTWAIMEKGGVLVNSLGRRFTNENSGYSAASVAVQAQPDGLAYVVFDERIYRDMEAHDPNFAELVQSGAVRGGGELEALAEALRVDGPGLKEAVRLYNLAAQGSTADALGRAHFGLAPLEAPFYGIRVRAALFHTQGGLEINRYAQPLRKDGTPIGNLFCGGGVAVGISGGGCRGYSPGNGLLTALGWGRIAGLTAAAQVRARV